MTVFSSSLYLAYLSVLFLPGQYSPLSACLLISTLTALITANSNRYATKDIARIYLLRNGVAIRVQTVMGESLDYTVGGFKAKTLLPSANILSVECGSGIELQVKLKQATYFDPVLMYAALNPLVSTIKFK